MTVQTVQAIQVLELK